VDVGVPGGERGNVQTIGGDRVSAISQLGYITSVALATGPSDEEEVCATVITVHCRVSGNTLTYVVYMQTHKMCQKHTFITPPPNAHFRILLVYEV